MNLEAKSSDFHFRTLCKLRLFSARDLPILNEQNLFQNCKKNTKITILWARLHSIFRKKYTIGAQNPSKKTPCWSRRMMMLHLSFEAPPSTKNYTPREDYKWIRIEEVKGGCFMMKDQKMCFNRKKKPTQRKNYGWCESFFRAP